MVKKHIFINSQGFFVFAIKAKKGHGYTCLNISEDSNVKCDYCHNTYLDANYVELIRRLKRKGLLPENFKRICCLCFIKKR